MKKKFIIIRWMEKRRQNHIERMRNLGKCPDCRGFGVVVIPMNYSGNNIECHMCKGTGKFTIWEENN